MLVVLLVLLAVLSLAAAALPAARPAPEKRTYASPAVDALIDGLAPLFINADMAVRFVF